MESLTTRQNKEIRNQTLKTLNWMKQNIRALRKLLNSKKSYLSICIARKKTSLNKNFWYNFYARSGNIFSCLTFRGWSYPPVATSTRVETIFLGDEIDTFQQQVEKLISFLKNEMAEFNTQVSDHSRNNEESLLQEFSSSYTQQEL
ncbi:uncharacterized protein [Pocillopora verrucosa]|uniref:uncharacterized protein isoform X1 n=2 Tax=Pocillopora verrucosa TaxID=203993 RepID=UPI00279743C8|nr:uncharacterized protein LOC131794168 isoform X1 [Pocillopora verrucosa]XP_058967676.1 uncharacterized protein LOC131794168 isoform X1 [Pocillopora verrucosa]